jgi:eukaryotic-like serine/threonine-protein kinase
MPIKCLSGGGLGLDEPFKDGADAHARRRIALVFTDVVGSSAAKRAAALGVDASARDRAYLEGIQAKHLRLIRSTLAEYNGTEIMTIGDSFFLVFEDPVDAIHCAATIQQRLSAQPIDTPSGPMQLRIGVHVGTPEYFDNSWHGTDVDMAARAQSAGSPQQIVVTDHARKAMGDLFDIKFRPLGTFSLKGVGDVKLWDAGYDPRKLRRASLTSREQRRRRRVATTVAFILAASALAFGAVWRWRQDRQAAILAGAAKQSIIVTNFENKTGDPVFDTMLTEGFIAQLEQSPVLKLVGEQHLRQSIKYLAKSSDSELTPEVVREIGIREGVKAYLAGSIAKLGDAYVINVSAKDISTGDDIVSEEAQARDKEHVLGALGKVATAMRARLGESLRSIQKLDAPLGQATTPSLEAFQAYALGDVEHESGEDVPEAEAQYRKAVEIDPNFAMAWARLGIVAVNYGQQEEVVEDFRNAYRLSNNIAEREKMYIAAQYYHYVLGDLPKTIATFELASRTYPMDSMNSVNLAWAYGDYGQLDGFLSEFQKVVKADPFDGIAQQDLLYAQLTLDMLPQAEATLADMKRRGLDNAATGVLDDHVMFDFLKNDEADIQRTMDQAESHPDRYAVTSFLALAREFEGRYREASDDWARAQAQAAAAKAYYLQASYHLFSVSGRANLGRCDGVAKEIRAALSLDRSKDILKQAAFSAALCNQRETALPLLAELAKNYSSDTLVNQVTIPQSRAALALAAHRPADALHELEGSKKFDLVSPGGYLRGLAYLDLHDGANAIESFRAATQYRGAAYLSCQNYAQAQLGLARAEMMTGDMDAARKSYQQFFTTWKTADEDLPPLIAAKREFAALQ